MELGWAVRRIYCVGKNYDAHAREMGWTGEREPPFYFTKFPDALARAPTRLVYPPETADYHFEGELVVLIGAPGFRIAADAALSHVAAYAAGLDMTRRDLQQVARKAGRPWDLGKNFDQAAVLGPLVSAAEAGDLAAATITLTVDGETRQQAPIATMIYGVAEIIADLSRYGALAAGDLIYTGTPAGVGPVTPGQRIEVTVGALPPCIATVLPPA